MEVDLKSQMPSLTPILVILTYAALFHLLYSARDRFVWTRKTVDWLGRITRHGESIVLIWALIADVLAVVFIVIWLTGIH